jgi:hypothetical protein
VRVGSSLLEGSLRAFATPPGGEAAPVLGALATALGALFAGDTIAVARISGSLLLGAAAAALFWILVRRDRPIAVLGVAFLVLPPALASSFVARPDSALGGVLLLIAAGTRRWSLAWLATLTTPVAIPVAVWSLLATGRGHRRAFLAPGAVVGLVTLLSVLLPAGSRAQILGGLLSGWGVPGISSTLDALRRIWAGGALLAAPLVLPWLLVGTAPPGHVRISWLAALIPAVLLAEPGAFRGATAAILPMTCLNLALVVGAIPDPRSRVGAPSRPVLLAILVPLALLILGTSEDRRWRETEMESSARFAQIAEFLRERYEPPGSVLSEQSGALALFSGRVVHPLRGRESPASPSPCVTVFDRGLRPSTRSERALFEGPSFLARYAPLSFRRGPTFGIQDAVWVLRSSKTGAAPIDPAYAMLLQQGWRQHAGRDRAGARAAFRSAAEREPAGLGIAHEWLGVLLEFTGNAPEAELAFREARLRDPTAIRARGHLIDRALTADLLAEADTMLAEAFLFTSHEPVLWGTRARLNHLAGYPREALAASHRAVMMHGRNVRLVANHGALLWADGDRDSAREMWRRAVRLDPKIASYLGDFERAPDDAPAPPLVPLFSFEGFLSAFFDGPATPEDDRAE